MAIFQQFPTISEDFQRLRKIAEDSRCPETATAPLSLFFNDFPGAVDNAKRLRVFHENPSKHLTLFSPGTVNNEKKKTR